jgi:hypothetical protein
VQDALMSMFVLTNCVINLAYIDYSFLHNSGLLDYYILLLLYVGIYFGYCITSENLPIDSHLTNRV